MLTAVFGTRRPASAVPRAIARGGSVLRCKVGNRSLPPAAAGPTRAARKPQPSKPPVAHGPGPAPHLVRQSRAQQEATVLENVRRPGYWNGGTADMFPQIITRIDMWPTGRSLRIIDCAHDTITLWGPDGTMRTHHGRSAELLPEPAPDEVILMRTDAHFVRISPENDDVIRNVSADGDCFFSCLSDAFGVPLEGRPDHNRRLRDAIARLMASDRELMMIACVPDGAPARPARG